MSVAAGHENKEAGLSRIRATLFPIHTYEFKKFFSITGLMFLTIFNSQFMRIMKDALVMSGAGSGAEVLPFLKLGGSMPVAILMVICYVKLIHSIGYKKTYYLMVSSFIGFVFLFVTVLYPNREWLHPAAETISHLKLMYPHLQWLFPAYGAWVYTLYYIVAELWSTFCLTVLFWQFANNNVSTQQAKRFYPLFILLAHTALFFVSAIISSMQLLSEEAMVIDLNMVIIAAGLCLLLNFWWVNRYVLTDPRYQNIIPKGNKKKIKLSIKASFKAVFSSNYIAYIVVLVLCYGVLINIMEITWKSHIKLLYPTAKEQLLFSAWYTKRLACVIITLIFLGKGVIRRFGWLYGAIATPLVVGIFGSLFFMCVLGMSHLHTVMDYFDLNALSFVVDLGTIGVMLSKSTKYAFFDPSKEMAYIPLDYDLRITGKAATDGIGQRLGKSGGSIIQAVLMMVTAARSILMVANYLAYVVFSLSLIWLWAVTRLNKLYTERVQAKSKMDDHKNIAVSAGQKTSILQLNTD